MCKPASFIVTRDNVLWMAGTNHHEDIIDANNLKDNTKNPKFVRVEVNPPEKDGIPQYDAPLDEWIFKTDQDYLPSWYVESVEEERVRKVLPDWYKSHIEGQITDAEYVTQTAGNRSTQKAGNYSTQTARHESTQNAGNWSTQNAGNRSNQKAGNRSTQKAGYESTQIARHYSTQNAGDDSTQKAGNRSNQKAGNRSTQKAGYESTQIAGNRSTQKAGIGSVQIGRWYEGRELKTVCRVVTEKEANKPYLFEDGIWTEVK